MTFVYKFLHGPVFMFDGYIPRRGVDGAMVTLCLMSEEQPDFSMASAASIFPPAVYEGSHFLTVANTYFLIFVIIKAVLINMKYPVALICISLMTSDTEYIRMCCYLFLIFR